MGKKKPKRKKPTPVCLAMILCDQIITDQITGKRTLVGIFSHIGALSLPCTHSPMSVFISLTEGRGQYNGEIRLTHAETDHVLFHANGPLKFENPLQVVEIVMVLPPIQFGQPGVYLLEFYAEGTLLSSRKFNVQPREDDKQ
ncbi:MAG: hypothetical protein K8R91_04480 [Phycisphaerae bacterium]|nr:hypothetical protein [Phycisphaerae bacterium]